MSLPNAIDDLPVSATPAPSIPVLDLALCGTATVAGLTQGCLDWGLVHLVGHGLPPDLTRGVDGAARAFFALPANVKRATSRSRENPWGYYDRELTKNLRDRKEIFDIPWETDGSASTAPFQGCARWPEEPAAFTGAMSGYLKACADLSDRVLELLAASLGVDRERLSRHFRPSPSSFLRLNHYPVRDALEPELGKSDLGIHHHTDAGALTLLLQDEVSGLQVVRDGVWYDVEPRVGALTMNIGDLVQVWSNDRYRAPIHRVRSMTRQDRYSVAFFYNPDYAAVIAPETSDAPPRYRAFTWGEFRAGRAEGDFGDYGQEVQIADYRI
jgi:isopenicillin N synthase-like dioxygenase